MHEHTLTFSLLGMVRAQHGSTELDLGSPQQRATLANLLLHGGSVVSLDELIGGLWGDESPRSAVTTVRTYVSRLRRVFSAAAEPAQVRLDSVRGGYVLRVPADALDVSIFRQHTTGASQAVRQGDFVVAAGELREALDLCHGQPLAGTVGPYVEGQRVRLEEVVTTARIELLRAQVHLGHIEEVIPDLTAMVSTYPLREEVHGLLMAALYGSGRGAEALEHYLMTRRMFVDDFGVEPGGRLRELHQRILAKDPTLPTSTAPQVTFAGLINRPHRPSSSTAIAALGPSYWPARRPGTALLHPIKHADRRVAAGTDR